MAARIWAITFNYPGVYFELALPVPFAKQLLQNSANRNVSMQSENVHLRQKKRFMGNNDLWLIHTARDRDRKMMGFYIMLCAVHTTQGQAQWPGPGLGNDRFLYYAMCCTHYTGTGTGTWTGTGKWWVSILCYVLYTLHRGRHRDLDRDRETMGFCITLCAVHTI